MESFLTHEVSENSHEEFLIRPIKERDNLQVAHLVRSVIDEHHASQTNSVYDDPMTDHVYESLQNSNAQYWVIDYHGDVIGGCGFFPTKGLPDGCAEIIKYYLLPFARGKRLGSCLLDFVIEKAKEAGYTQLYIETVPLFAKAIEMYTTRGFRFLPMPLGNTGHSAPNIFMSKPL